MLPSRRELFAAAGAVRLAAAESAATTPPSRFPFKAEFPVVDSETCLNNARWHPLSRGAMKAVRDYLDYKASGGGQLFEYSQRQHVAVKQHFAKLINAKPSEIAFTPSTLAGENAIATALALGSGSKVVTDALHFEGSLYLYGELARQGLDFHIVRPRNWRVELEDLDRAMGKNTKLLAVSLVSMMNGFQYDLKAVCDLAHSRGALVFADVVQAAGAVPIDVRASGVDFCSCASYKWLMGDMGVGFLYVREEHLDRLKRPVYGYKQLTEMEYHLFPHDAPGKEVFEWKATRDAAGYFEVGTISNTTIAALSYSLQFLLETGVERIAAHRRPLLERLRRELPKMGFEPLTPEGSDSALLVFAKKGIGAQASRLKAAKIDISVYPNRIRLSPSVYNDMTDVNRVLEALS